LVISTKVLKFSSSSMASGQLGVLPPSTVRLLTSGQAVTCVSDAVKELTENALDAGAQALEIRLDNYGLDKITVSNFWQII